MGKKIIQVPNKIQDDPDQLILVPVRITFPFRDGEDRTQTDALLLTDDNFQTYTYPVSLSGKNVAECIKQLIEKQGQNPFVSQMLIDAYMERKSVIIMPKMFATWHDYEHVFEAFPFYKPLEPPAKVEEDWKRKAS
jgi:hypothetical protein